VRSFLYVHSHPKLDGNVGFVLRFAPKGPEEQFATLESPDPSRQTRQHLLYYLVILFKFCTDVLFNETLETSHKKILIFYELFNKQNIVNF
jgi:hypothetical protein